MGHHKPAGLEGSYAMSEEQARRAEVVFSRDRVSLVVLKSGLEHPAGAFHKSGDVIEVTGPVARTFLWNGWCDLAPSETTP